MTSFFSLSLSPSSSSTFTPDRSTVLHITNLALDPSSVSGNTTLSIKSHHVEGVVATLNANKTQCVVEIVLPGGREVEWKVEGKSGVSVVGWKQPFDDEEMGMEEEEMDSEEEAADRAELGLDNSDSENGSEDGSEQEDGLEDMEEDDSESEEEEEEAPELVPPPKKEQPKKEAPKVVEKKQEAKKEESKKEAKKEEPKKEAKKEEPKKEEKKPEVKKENANKPITLPNGLMYTDTKVGTGPEAKVGRRVNVYYVGKLQNGKIFDQSTSGKGFQFNLGQGEVIQGWDQGIKGMKVGGKRRLVIPAKLGYGSAGSPPVIPSNAILLFEVELLRA